MGGIFSEEESKPKYTRRIFKLYKPKYNKKDYTKICPGINSYKIYKKDVYWRGDNIIEANGLNFIDIGSGYGKDLENVFYKGFKIKVNDLKSFKIIYDKYSKDKFNIFYMGKKMLDVDVNSFKVDKY